MKNRSLKLALEFKVGRLAKGVNFAENIYNSIHKLCSYFFYMSFRYLLDENVPTTTTKINNNFSKPKKDELNF